MTGKAGNRWWEFNVIRYMAGTVVGAVIVVILVRTNPIIAPVLGISDLSYSSDASLWLLGAYGLAYCYIASAPILVFHAARFAKYRSTRELRTLIGIGIAAVLLFPAGAWKLSDYMLDFEPFNFDKFADRVFFTFLSAVLGFLTAYLSIKVYLAFVNVDSRYEQYYQLAKWRTEDESDFVESYKHLREHGNSFFIIVCELILGLLLAGLGNLPVYFANQTYAALHPEAPLSLDLVSKETFYTVLVYLGVIFIWIIPASLVYAFAFRWERAFADRGPV